MNATVVFAALAMLAFEWQLVAVAVVVVPAYYLHYDTELVHCTLLGLIDVWVKAYCDYNSPN